MKFVPKLTALFISISATIVAVTLTVAYFQVGEILESEIRARMENHVLFTMDALDRFLYEKLSDISVISHDPVISSGNVTAEQITERLIFFRNTYKCYASLSFFNLERIRIADTAGLNIGEQNRMTRYWEDVLSGKVSAATDVHIAKDLQVPIVNFASAVNNKEGRAIGVVVARIPTRRLFEMVKGSTKIQEEEEIDLINKDGLLIYSNHNREGILKENLPEWESIKIAQREKIFGSVKYRNPDEKEAEIHAFCREQGYLDFKGNGWIVIFNVPTQVIFGPVNKLLKILIIMFLAMLPGLALVIYLFSKTVTRPLNRLTFAVTEIGNGKLDTVIEVKSKDEFGSLANTFNQMVADLKKTTTSIDNLNKEITERKRAEEALRESEKRFRLAAESSTDLIYEWDIKERLDWFGKIDELLGYSPSEFPRTFEAWANSVHPEDRDRVMVAVKNHLEKNEPFNIEYRVRKKDGTYNYWWVRGNAVRDEKGNPYRWVGAITDITGRKRVEEMLGASEQRYRMLFEGAAEGILVADIESKQFKYVNPAACRMLGYTAEELTRLSLADIHPKEALDYVVAEFEALVRGEKTLSPEIPCLRKDGSVIYTSITSAPVVIDGRQCNVGFFTDITERKRVEEVLHESEELYRALIETSPDAILLADTNTNFIMVNQMAVRLYGYQNMGEMIGKTFLDHIPPEERPRLFEHFKKTLQTKNSQAMEHTALKKDGSSFPAEVNASLLVDTQGRPKGTIAIVRDITERKRVEDVLRESEERSRSLIETSPDVIMLIDFSGKIILVNGVALTTYGYESGDELIGRSVLDLVIPEDRPRIPQEISKVLEVKTLRNLEYTSLKKDGSTFSIEVSASLILDAQQKPTSIVIMIRDITGRKRAEEALRESEEQYRSVLDNIEYGYFEVDIAGNFTFFNDSLCRILGYSRGETMGMNNRQYMDKENTQKVYQAFNRVYTTGEPYRSFDWEILRKDGTKRFVESSVSLLRDLKGEGIGFRGIVRDITDRKFAEEALRRSEEEAKRLAQENAVMAEIGEIISSTLNIEEVYERFADEVFKIIPFDRIVINIISIEKNTVSNVYMAGKGIADRKVGEIYPLKGSGNVEMVRTNSSLLIQTEDFVEYQDRFPTLLSTFQAGFRSIMNVPLFSKGKIIGGLLLRSLKPYAYMDKDVRLAERVANQIAGAIANAQLFIERKRALEDREQLILKLQKALTEVKQLSGLLPICASCKKIRDDKGYWGQIESYISDHSEAEFSHGICPDCMKKLYPDFADDKNSV